jgi:formylglycine-generating enzyme required for sulfatase activity
MQELMRQDVRRYTEALAKTGVPPGKTDPVSALAARYEWDLDVALAAAEVGLPTTEFQERLPRSGEIARLFGPLSTPGGTVRREVFEKNFNDLLRVLHLAEAVPAATKVKEVEKVTGVTQRGDDIVTNSVGMKFKPVPVGGYTVGSAREEPGREDGEKLRSVEITRAYFIGIHEVTQEQYTKVIGTNPSFFCASGGGSARVRNQDTRQFPVESLSWVQARDFCTRLSALPEEKAAGRTYRLPSEAEWEIACRAGASTAFACGDDATRLADCAWYDKNAEDTPHPVGKLKPNAWGLYDMHGNVREWCADHWDGVGHLPLRVQRGGSWLDSAGQCRAAYRGRSLEKFGGAGGKNFGLRAVMESRGAPDR